MRRFLAVLLLASVAAPRSASANPKLLPFSYGTRTMAPGDLEMEGYIDTVPMRVARELEDGTSEAVTTPRYVLQTELEIGLTERLELGIYTQFRQAADADGAPLQFQGLKQRVRYRVTEPGEWPVDVALYGEIAELRDEIELEEKILLERRFGAFTALANLWIEQEWYWIADETKFLYNPTVGLAYELHPAATIGLEYWARGRFDTADGMTGDDESGGTRQYLGPTLTVQKGEYWLTLGAYARLDRLGEDVVLDDAGGSAWIRLILGIGL